MRSEATLIPIYRQALTLACSFEMEDEGGFNDEGDAPADVDRSSLEAQGDTNPYRMPPMMAFTAMKRVIFCCKPTILKVIVKFKEMAAMLLCFNKRNGTCIWHILNCRGITNESDLQAIDDPHRASLLS